MLDDERYRRLVAEPVDPDRHPVPFDHPLWVLFTSGTTGRPKGIARSAGCCSRHLRAAVPAPTSVATTSSFWHTAQSWMMPGLPPGRAVVRATIVGLRPPDVPRRGQAGYSETGASTSSAPAPGHLLASRKAGLHPGAQHDLSRLRALGSTGSPLPGRPVRWVKAEVGGNVGWAPISGEPMW